MKLRIFAILALLSPFGFTLPVAAIETFNYPVNSEIMLLAQRDWQAYNSDRFTIQLPGQPVTSTNSEEIAEGLTLTFDEITFENDTGAYGLIYTDLPNDYLQETDSQTVLDDMSALFLIATQLEGLKELEESINFQGNPGREYRINEQDLALALQLYLVEKRVYFLFAVSEQPNQVNQFLNSFSIRPISDR
jgi:hypothetical protein